MPKLLIAATQAIFLRDFLLPFARHFAARGWHVDAMARDASSCPECRAAFHRTWDAPWSRDLLDPANLARAPRVVREVVAGEGYDIVHVHTPVAAFVARRALRGLRGRGRVAVVYTAHGFYFHRGGGALGNGTFLALERLAGRATDYLVVLNREDEAAAIRHRIVSPDRVVFMPGIGVDLGHFNAARVPDSRVAVVRRELGLTPEQPLFLVVAQFIGRKRHRDALRAFARLTEPAAHLALAGEGPLVGDVRRLAGALGVAERVHFLGFRSDIPDLIRAADAVVLASDREGMPRCLLEALAMGTATIGADARGTRELLAGGCGILVPVGDVGRLAEAMGRVARRPGDLADMAARGRERIAAGYGLDAILTLHEQLYDRCLEIHRANPQRAV